MTDYLRTLPIEIWQEILREIPTDYTFKFDRSSDPLLFLCELRHRDKEEAWQMQRKRMQLLLVSRSFKPIAEEILYSNVYLRSSNLASFVACASPKKNGVVARFLAWANAKEVNGPGVITSRITLDLEDSKFRYAHSLSLLTTVCPNLDAVALSCSIEDQVVVKKSLRKLGGRVNVMQWTSSPDARVSFSYLAHFNSLTSLYLDGECYQTPQAPSRTPITLPSLKVLKVNVVGPSLDHITCPVLVWFSIIDRILDHTSIIEFSKRHAQNIRGLEIVSSAHSITIWGPYMSCRRILSELEKLEVLIVGDGALKEFRKFEEPGLVLSSSIKEIFLLLPTSQGKYIKEFEATFFPNIERQVFVWMKCPHWMKRYVSQRTIESGGTFSCLSKYGYTIEHRKHPHPDSTIICDDPYIGGFCWLDGYSK